MILAANFKSNLVYEKIRHYYEALDCFLGHEDEVYVFAPFYAMKERAKNFHIGVQNAYPAFNGAFSGEITLEALEDFGIETLLIGHSERRNLLGENQAFCAKKFDFFAQHGMKIFYCVGESLEIRKKGRNAIEDYLSCAFEGIAMQYPHFVVAYEPIWAIGTGVSASIEEIGETHEFLRSLTQRPLLYGGSVNVKNIEEILKIQNVDGVLVGSASLEVNQFLKMIEIARSVG